MPKFFRSFFTVSFYTTLSRILGFMRDIFIAKYLGSTVTADAFFVAFRLPNFFRRVLAEGAYSAALIPVFSGIVIDSKDDKEAADFVENTMSFLLCTTVPLTIIFYFGMPYIIQILAPGFSANKEAFDLAVHFGKIIFPYLIFISLVAHFASINNVHGKFVAGAFAPAILNIFLQPVMLYLMEFCSVEFFSFFIYIKLFYNFIDHVFVSLDLMKKLKSFFVCFFQV